MYDPLMHKSRGVAQIEVLPKLNLLVSCLALALYSMRRAWLFLICLSSHKVLGLRQRCFLAMTRAEGRDPPDPFI